MLSNDFNLFEIRNIRHTYYFEIPTEGFKIIGKYLTKLSVRPRVGKKSMSLELIHKEITTG